MRCYFLAANFETELNAWREHAKMHVIEQRLAEQKRSVIVLSLISEVIDRLKQELRSHQEQKALSELEHQN